MISIREEDQQPRADAAIAADIFINTQHVVRKDFTNCKIIRRLGCDYNDLLELSIQGSIFMTCDVATYTINVIYR